MSRELSLREILEIATSKLGIVDDNKIYEFLKQYSNRRYIHPTTKELVKVSDVLDESVKIIEGRMKGEISKGLTTGFPIFDSFLGFIQKDQQIVLAARPGVGKTASRTVFQDNIYDLNHNKDNIAIAMLDWNFEMANYQSMNRYISKATKMTNGQLMSKKIPLTNEEFQAVLKSRDKMKNRYHFMIDIPKKVTDIESVVIDFAGKFKQDNPDKDCYVINTLDHGLLALSEGTEKTTTTLEALSGSLVRVKKAEHTTNILLSQTKDESVKEDRRNYQFEPKASDLAYSQRLEQDADTIILIHSPYRFGLETYTMENAGKRFEFPTMFKDENGETTPLLVYIIPKNRYGSIGKVLFKDLIKINNIMEISNPPDYFAKVLKNEKFKAPR